MPKYKFSHGGKNYSVTANSPDEAGTMIDAVVAELGGQTKALEAPQAPGMIERMKSGLVSSIPGMNTYKAATEGGSGSDLAASIGADLGQVGILGASAASGGVPLLAKAAGANAALGAATGALEPVIEASGKAGRAVGETLNPLQWLPKNSTSVPLNMLRETAGTIGETAGELVPSAAMMFLGGKLAQGAAKPPVEIPKYQESVGGAMRPLSERGYPLTESHFQPGDVRLRGMMDNPALAEQAQAYTKKLEGAQGADYAATVKPPMAEFGDEATASLGNKFRESYKGAIEKRSAGYKAMMDRLGMGEGPDVTGIGKKTHAGQAINKSILSELQNAGVDVKMAREKVLLGQDLTAYDVPPNMSAADVSAIIKFGDVASQKAPKAAQLSDLASNFAKSEKLYEKGADSAGFKRKIRNMALDQAEQSITKMDEMNKRQGYKPELPEFKKQRANWAQGSDIAEQKGAFVPRKDALGRNITSEMTSPELIFKKHIMTNGAENVKEFKSFLESNGQDPGLIRQMGLDYLDSKAGGKELSVPKFESAWKGIDAEIKNEVFGKPTVKAIDELVSRLKKSREPLEVMGIQAKGGSPTNPKSRISQFLESPEKAKRLGATLGGAIGIPIGGPVGSAAGAGLGYIAGDVLAAKALKNQKAGAAKFLNASPESFYESKTAKRAVPYMPWLKKLSPGNPALAGASALGTAQATR
jgi:osmotically-inducible protein OsmY